MTSSLEERGGEVLRAFGISFETAWEEHRHLLRRRYSDGLVMGHFFHISEGWEDMEGVWENVKECCNPSNSVGRNEANGFFFYLVVGDYSRFVVSLLKMPKMKYFIGYRRGNVYLYGRKEARLHLKLIERNNRHGGKSI